MPRLRDRRRFLLERLELLRELGELLRRLRGLGRERLGLGLAIAARALELRVGGGDRAGVLAALVLDDLRALAALAERRVIERVGGDRGAAERDEVALARDLADLLLAARAPRALSSRERSPASAVNTYQTSPITPRLRRSIACARNVPPRALASDGAWISVASSRVSPTVVGSPRSNRAVDGSWVGFAESIRSRAAVSSSSTPIGVSLTTVSRLRRDPEDRVGDALLLRRVRERDAQLVVGIVAAAVELADRHGTGQVRGRAHGAGLACSEVGRGTRDAHRRATHR